MIPVVGGNEATLINASQNKEFLFVYFSQYIQENGGSSIRVMHQLPGQLGRGGRSQAYALQGVGAEGRLGIDNKVYLKVRKQGDLVAQHCGIV